MRIRGSRLVTAVAVAAVTCLGLAPPAQADDDDGEVTVRPGESIQAAIDAADPGTEITIKRGTYEESLTITKDGIELRGEGAVLLLPPADADSPCGPGHGVCIVGEFDPVTFEAIDRVKDVRVRGITVDGAAASGLLAVSTEDLRVSHSTFMNSGEYGAASFDTQGTRFEENRSHDNHEAGFYIGDSPEADARVEENLSTGNEIGFFFRSASHGKVEDNKAEGNCLGILVLADAPDPATDWKVEDNRVADNNKVCPGVPPDIPPLSGAGIVMFGAQAFQVEDNRVTGHTSAAPSAAQGGIVVLTGFAGTEPSGKVEDNRLSGNTLDILSAHNGDVRFDDNRCDTSDPDGLCDG